MSGLESNRYTGSDHVDVMKEIEHASSRYEVPLDSLSPNQAEAMRSLGELANLPPNWDAYGSPPPTRVALNVVIDVLLHIADFIQKEAERLPLREELRFQLLVMRINIRIVHLPPVL
jgi:hypothetical protein